MTDCNQQKLEIPGVGGRPIEIEFSGGDITGDGGSLLLRMADKALGLLKRVAKILPDPRNKLYTQHSTEQMLRQRVYGIALGYEDLNDHDTLKQDLGLQAAVDQNKVLASSPTLHRFENRASSQVAWDIHRQMMETFIASFKTPPKSLILDFDATDDPVYGKQEGRFFHGYYDSYCFLPLYVFCGEQLLVSYLRPSKIDGAKHAWGILALLVNRFRQEWPEVEIIFRGDSGFCRHRMLSWCERHGVGYIAGIAQNKVLNRMAEPLHQEAKQAYEATQEKQRLFSEMCYGAESWGKQRRVIAKAEHTNKGSNPRYVVTNLDGEPQALYDNIYCARGDMENRIKEQQLYLFAGRTSCHHWWPNQFRLLLSSLAYILVETIRRQALVGTELAHAQCHTIRLKLFKVGAIVLRNTRRIRFLLASGYPYQALFFKVLQQFSSA